jgi:hypothetical protein
MLSTAIVALPVDSRNLRPNLDNATEIDRIETPKEAANAPDARDSNTGGITTDTFFTELKALFGILLRLAPDRPLRLTPGSSVAKAIALPTQVHDFNALALSRF